MECKLFLVKQNEEVYYFGRSILTGSHTMTEMVHLILIKIVTLFFTEHPRLIKPLERI